MAIGKSYPKDNKIQDADLFLGTKASNLSTVNYTAQSVADYLNTKGKISIGGQMVFQFVIVNPSVGTISLPGEGGDGATFSSITNLIVSINDMSSQNVVNFIDYIVGSEILLTEQNAISVFGNYKITDYTITSNPGFYNLTLEYIGGYGNINKDLFYDLTFFRDTGSSTSSNLQEVTDNGNITTNDMIVDSVNYFSTLSPSELSTLTKYGETGTYISANGEVGIKTGIGIGIIKTTNLLDNLTLEFPNKTGVKTIATTDDITTGVTSVSATSPITSSGGTTPTISTSMSANKLIGRSTAGTGVMEEITLGTGLSFSGTTLNATGASPLTTKGDLYTFDTANTRLPIGLNNQVLTVDTATATGLKWTAQNTPTPLGYYGVFQDSTTQSAVSINTAYPVKLNTTDLTNGVSVVNDGSGKPTRVTLANTGIYNIQFSLQLEKTGGSGNMIADIWVRKNGVDIPSTTGKVVLTGSANASPIVAAWNYVLDLAAGDYVQLMWSTSNTNVEIVAAGATSPHPEIPSAILTVTQQSGIMAGTGITAINSLTGAAQTLTVGTTGTDFAIVDSGVDHKFNLPTASATNRGALSSTDWTTFNNKVSSQWITSGSDIYYNTGNVGITQPTPTSKLHIRTDALGNTTPAISSGIHLENTTPATATIFQNSPSLTLSGYSWNTSSRLSRFQMFVRPSVNASGGTELFIQSTINDTTVQTPMRLSENGNLQITNVITAIGGSFISGVVFNTGSNNTTSGNTNGISTTNAFGPTSGTATTNYINIAPTINQTGGASGITRGVYVNPTATATADWRAIETTNGKVILTDTISAGSGSLAGSLLDLRQTWNTTGAPTAIKLNVTNTASSVTNSLLMDLLVGGVSQFRVDRIGGVNVNTLNATTTITAITTVTAGNTSGFSLAGGTLSIRGQVAGSAGSGIYYTAGFAAYVAGQIFTGGNYTTPTSGTTFFHQINGIFAPTSGTATNVTSHINPTINQTGGANGTTWGLYINPTLTSAADFRAIEATNGSVVLPYATASATYAVKTSDYLLNFTTGTFTATLPTAVGCTGKHYIFKNTGSGIITIATTSSQTIDGVTTYVLAASLNKYVHVVSTGSNWIVIANN